MCVCVYFCMYVCVLACVHVYTFVRVLCVLDAQPTEGEREVWNQVNSVLQDSENILSGLQAYKGAGQEIRDVRNIQNHTHTQKFNPTHKHCTVNNTVLDVDDHYGPIHGCFLMLFCSFQAIQNPNDFMLQERAWNSVCPLVIKLKKFYSFSLRLGVVTGLKYCLTFNIFQKWIIQVTGTFPLYAEVKVIMYST